MLRCVILACQVVLILTACTRTASNKPHSNTSEDIPPLVLLCRNMDYTDTVALHDDTVMADRMASIVRLLPHTDSVMTRKALSVLFNGVKRDEKAIEMVARLADLYLENPASPVRNETLYIRFLQSMLSVDTLPEAVRFLAEKNLKTASLNRPGTIATNFDFVDRDGTRRSLYELHGENILVVFYDPECSHCTDILRKIAVNPRINWTIAEGKMTVVAIYTEGKKDVWESTRHNLPANWMVGYDLSGILENGLYDLPAMPIIYLLDDNKRVLLKDPNVQTIVSIR